MCVNLWPSGALTLYKIFEQLLHWSRNLGVTKPMVFWVIDLVGICRTVVALKLRICVCFEMALYVIHPGCIKKLDYKKLDQKSLTFYVPIIYK